MDVAGVVAFETAPEASTGAGCLRAGSDNDSLNALVPAVFLLAGWLPEN